MSTRLKEATDRYESESKEMEEKITQQQSDLKVVSGKKEKRKIVSEIVKYFSLSQKKVYFDMPKDIIISNWLYIFPDWAT